MGIPFTVTLPAAIKVSASLREQTPELAMYLFSRIKSGLEFEVGFGFLFCEANRFAFSAKLPFGGVPFFKISFGLSGSTITFVV